MPAASDDNASEVSARAAPQRVFRIPFAVQFRIFNLSVVVKAQSKSCFGQNLSVEFRGDRYGSPRFLPFVSVGVFYSLQALRKDSASA
jgi:hypothetical protein